MKIFIFSFLSLVTSLSYASLDTSKSLQELTDQKPGFVISAGTATAKALREGGLNICTTATAIGGWTLTKQITDQKKNSNLCYGLLPSLTVVYTLGSMLDESRAESEGSRYKMIKKSLSKTVSMTGQVTMSYLILNALSMSISPQEAFYYYCLGNTIRKGFLH